MRSVYVGAVLAVLLALACSVSYGVADFLGGLASRGAPVLRVVGLAMLASLVVEAGLLPLVGSRWSAAALTWGGLAGVASAAGFALLFRSLALGPMGVLSPVTAVVSAVLPAAFGFAEGERLGAPGVAGIALAIIAVIAVSAGSEASGHRPSAIALALAVGAGGAIAAQLVFLSKTPHDSGVIPLVACRVVSVLVLLAAMAARRRAAAAGRPDLRMALSSGLFDAAANVAFLVAVRSGSLVVVAVITALYPGATVLLARRFLGERLTGVQLAGLVTAAAAVTILAAS
jgi:drug/metabolite transporter (DMT)-like permease